MTCRGGEIDLRFVGDPIDVVTGAFIEDALDFQIADPSPIVWRRLYSTRDIALDRGLGIGHTHSFDHRLKIHLDGIGYTAPSGTNVEFPAFTDSSVRVAARGHVLHRRGSELVVETPDDLTIVFQMGAVAEARPIRVGDVRLGYDPVVGRLISLSNEQGSTVVLTWDAAHITGAEGKRTADARPTRLATYRYDANRLTDFEDAYGATMRYAHDAEGRVVARADRTGYKFGFRYDVDGRCVHSAAEDGVLEVKLEYFPLERRTKVTKSDGGVWEYFYSDVGTLLTIVDGEGGTRTFVPRESDGQIGSETDGAGNEYQYVYDADGRFLAKRDCEGRSVRTNWRHPTPADAREYQLGRFGAPPGAEVRAIEDIQGLLVREERDGASRRFAYDRGGNIRWETDLDGVRTDYRVESFFQLREERDANSYATLLDYDKESELVGVVDPGGSKTVYLRNKRSEIVAIARAGAWYERYRRDGAGQLIGKDDAGKPLYELTRGPQGEVLERTFASGGFERFEYDHFVRIVKGETAAGTATFDYDALGQRTVDELDGVGARRHFEGKRLTKIGVLGAFFTRYRTSETGAVTITDPAGGTHRLRDLGDGSFVRECAGGRVETLRYHVNGNCLSRVVDGGQGARWERTFEYSPEGYLLARHDSLRGTTRYRHDIAHRLVGEAPPHGAALTFDYDRAGNIVQNGARSLGYRAGNILAHADGKTYAHDVHQAVESESTPDLHRRFERDERGQLIAVHTDTKVGDTWQPAAGWTAAYDALNRRVSKTVAGQTTRFVWDTDRLAAEIAPDGRLRVYGYADDFALSPLFFIDYANIESKPESGIVYLVFADQLGAPERIERTDGAIVWSATYRPYGEVAIDTGADFFQPLRWPGHYFDEELGLHYNRFRTYSPTLGRYLEPDPIGRDGGLENVYAYTANPLRFVDIDGLTCPKKAKADKKKKDREPEGKDDEEGGRRRNEKGQFERDPDAPMGLTRDDLYPSGFRKSTHDEMAMLHTDEGAEHVQAFAEGTKGVPEPPPVCGNGGKGKPLDRDQMTWRDADGNEIDYYQRDSKGRIQKDSNGKPITNLTYDHDPPVVDRYIDHGYDQTPAERADDFNDTDKLTPMSRSDNSSDGAKLGRTYAEGGVPTKGW